MFGRATIRLGIGPHSSWLYFYYIYLLLHRSTAAVSAADGWMRDQQMVPVGG